MTDDLTSVLRAAKGHLDVRDYAAAIPLLTQAVHLAPQNFTILHAVGVACLFAHRPVEAATWLRRAIRLRPDVARVHFDLGLALEPAGADDGAIAAHRCAIALDPSLAGAHGKLGDLLYRKNCDEEAATAFDSAFRAAPGTTYGWLCKAKSLAARTRSTEAQDCFASVLDRIAATGEGACWEAEAELLLGHLLLDGGRLDEAAARFDRSIQLDPAQSTAHYAVVSSKKITEADRPILERIQKRMESPDLTERQRMILAFAAGKALDDLRDYSGAIKHFDAANRIRRKLVPFDRNDMARRVDALIARFPHESFAHASELGKHDETPVLVLGMPRSGTTLVERILSNHPRVGGGGELRFWNENAPPAIAAEHEKLAGVADDLCARYLRVLCGVAPGVPRATDKMPFNFLWIGLVHALFPRARIVHCRRNPVDTCLSVYTTYFSSVWPFASHQGDLVAYYREYSRLMNHWRAVLPADRFLEVDYEQATAAPEETARRLIGFCGLEWDAACLRPELNTDVVRTANRWHARQPIYRSSVDRWRNYEPWLGELRTLLPT